MTTPEVFLARQKALEMAHDDWRNGGTMRRDIIKTAREYEAYLLGLPAPEEPVQKVPSLLNVFDDNAPKQQDESERSYDPPPIA